MMDAMEEVFGQVGDKHCLHSTSVTSKPSKLQSWSNKVTNATSGKQVTADRKYCCKCSKQCRNVYLESYANEGECEKALLALRTERTAGTQSDEATWLFDHLYSSRCRQRGIYTVLFVLDGVRVCEEYFTVAMGFTFPNRRIQKYVRTIQVNIVM